MTELEDFHRDFLPRFIDAQRAFHDGDPAPNIALWTAADPVTPFAARGLIDSGAESVTQTFENVAATVSDLGEFEWRPLAEEVHGDLAYTVALERYANARDGGAIETTELRATHVCRRQYGKWRAVHRHADRKPLDAGDDFNAAIDAFRDALRQYVKGNPEHTATRIRLRRRDPRRP